MATVTVDQQRLVLNAFAATLQNNLVSADLVSWHKFEGEMNDRNGLTVVEQVGPRYAVTETVSGVADLSTGVQDSVFGSEQYTINRTFGSSMGWGDFVKIRDIGAARESEALKNAALNLAEKIDAHILRHAVLASNNWTGTAGNNVSAWADFATAYTRLKEEGVDDSELRAVLTYADKQALGTSVLSYAAPDSLVEGVYRKGFQGEVDGIPTIFTQQLPTFTVGTRVASAAGLINGAAQNVDYADVAKSTAPGFFMTQTISIDGLTGSATIKDGEVLTIANVNAWDNRLGASLARLQQFRVVGDHTATAGAIAALRIYPAMIVPGSGSGGDINVNTAHATVDAAPADNAAITFIGTASTAYKPRALLQKSAINVCTIDLIKPATGIGTTRSLTKVPISVRMWQHSDFATGAHSIRFDTALTANTRAFGRNKVIRLNGS